MFGIRAISLTLVSAIAFAMVTAYGSHAFGGRLLGRVEIGSAIPASGFQVEGQAPVNGSSPAESEKGAHMDHKSKHGGSFFMSLDNKHHLEGVLLPPGTFRVYLYDDHTRPLKAEETRESSGTVQVGDSDDGPKINLAPGKKKETLEATVGQNLKFPVNLVMLLRLPGMAPDAKPELFNFTFTRFTDEHGPGSCTPMPRMGMSC
jgi:hypothetical protein